VADADGRGEFGPSYVEFLSRSSGNDETLGFAPWNFLELSRPGTETNCDGLGRAWRSHAPHRRSCPANVGFNGTWRWRKAGRQAEFFDKFWIQTVRYLVEARSLEGRRRGYLQADRDRYEVGERITVTARLQDASYNPLAAPKIDAVLQTPDGPEPVVLLPTANRPGTFEAAVKARKPGLQTLRVNLPGGADGEALVLESQFTVELPSVETSEVWLDKPLLVDLAAISGGKYFDVNEVAQLAAAIPDKTQIHEIRSKPDPLWDVSGVLVALVGLLGVEWWVRKRCKLL
jgi:hypothetical protein